MRSVATSWPACPRKICARERAPEMIAWRVWSCDVENAVLDVVPLRSCVKPEAACWDLRLVAPQERAIDDGDPLDGDGQEGLRGLLPGVDRGGDGYQRRGGSDQGTTGEGGQRQHGYPPAFGRLPGRHMGNIL